MENELEKILEYYQLDTMELIDCVLGDDDESPDFSAVIAINRVKLYLAYIAKRDSTEELSVEKYLLSVNMPIEDINILMKKREIESHYFRGIQY